MAIGLAAIHSLTTYFEEPKAQWDDKAIIIDLKYVFYITIDLSSEVLRTCCIWFVKVYASFPTNDVRFCVNQYNGFHLL